LSGIGADELLGGYVRHRGAFARGSWGGLAAELALDVGRLWQRNLGRDDRCISDSGREVRQPFLDEHVLESVMQEWKGGSDSEAVNEEGNGMQALVDLKLVAGVGDKRSLRVVAHLLGLHTCAGLKKRAIQFGSRVAKLSDAKVKKAKQSAAAGVDVSKASSFSMRRGGGTKVYKV
jgi:asparagine synthetase B (glutamine-hydrolysing)